MTGLVTPLDPNSPRGTELAIELTNLFAQFELSIADRKRRAVAEAHRQAGRESETYGGAPNRSPALSEPSESPDHG
ncbi:hypothetical protein [Polymorphospora rubra]|uniref:Uncharacterized protein n=1 Tax=Polymorphospora rubra TaxID=338584 RepID=A0A810MZZ5_9ACTN|nr:hypothetical protein [Polymorphospora rubra]BCJ65123.1 hypothetical protein Prubr_21440 [Polymorphospora rubra]